MESVHEVGNLITQHTFLNGDDSYSGYHNYKEISLVHNNTIILGKNFIIPNKTLHYLTIYF